MVFTKNDTVFTDQGHLVCHIDDVPAFIQHLKTLHTEHYLDSGRFTAEGIDREFRAPEGFTTNRALWEQDAVNNWQGIPGRVLFERYPVHAECYVSGVIGVGVEPTYEGFRLWLTELNQQRKSIEGWDDE